MYRNYRDAAVVACSSGSVNDKNLGQLLDTLHSPRAGGTKWHSRVFFLSASSVQSSCNSGAEYSITAARARNLRSANSFRRTIESNYVIGSFLLVWVRSGRNRVLVPRARLMSCGTMQTRRPVCIREKDITYVYISLSLSLLAEPRLDAVLRIKFLQRAMVSDACT